MVRCSGWGTANASPITIPAVTRVISLSSNSSRSHVLSHSVRSTSSPSFVVAMLLSSPDVLPCDVAAHPLAVDVRLPPLCSSDLLSDGIHAARTRSEEHTSELQSRL